MPKNNTRRNRNKSRRNKTEGGSNCGMKLEGGKRRNKTRRNKTVGGKRKGSEWTKKVTALYHKMKKENKDTTFMQALQRASELKKKGQL
jgi:hypothetical protein